MEFITANEIDKINQITTLARVKALFFTPNCLIKYQILSRKFFIDENRRFFLNYSLNHCWHPILFMLSLRFIQLIQFTSQQGVLDAIKNCFKVSRSCRQGEIFSFIFFSSFISSHLSTLVSQCALFRVTNFSIHFSFKCELK